MVGTHLYAWGHIMQHMDLAPGGRVLEYGPGSGQFLLMLARMGFAGFGVDVDAVALEGIRLQAEAMRLPVAVERALFGAGFDGERFDRIVFYEAFHHALDFQSLLQRLHDRLNPGGRVLLCGEPVVPDIFEGVHLPMGTQAGRVVGVLYTPVRLDGAGLHPPVLHGGGPTRRLAGPLPPVPGLRPRPPVCSGARFHGRAAGTGAGAETGRPVDPE